VTRALQIRCAEFPSSVAAAAVLAGEPGGVPRMVLWTGVRAAIIGGVAYAATRDAGRAALVGVGAATAIEAVLLAEMVLR